LLKARYLIKELKDPLFFNFCRSVFRVTDFTVSNRVSRTERFTTTIKILSELMFQKTEYIEKLCIIFYSTSDISLMIRSILYFMDDLSIKNIMFISSNDSMHYTNNLYSKNIIGPESADTTKKNVSG
jgi:PhoPQ-activated pathogenicity-related protein